MTTIILVILGVLLAAAAVLCVISTGHPHIQEKTFD